MSNKTLVSACAAGIHYLSQQQDLLGCWREYRLPVGPSDSWTTALVGFICADCSTRLAGAAASEADEVARRAGAWLCRRRDYPAGWGYNGVTGPDADSTAWALRLLRLIGEPIFSADVEFLTSHWVDGAGFATYRRSDAWGIAHCDVTPIVALALPAAEQAPWHERIERAVRNTRDARGVWPSYWWRSAHYATAATAELIATWHFDIRCDLCVDSSETQALHATFEAACALMLACLVPLPGSIVKALAEHLVRVQCTDGRWSGADSLRVTSPTCSQPWVVPEGRRYVDERGLVTTALAVRALCHCLEWV